MPNIPSFLLRVIFVCHSGDGDGCLIVSKYTLVSPQGLPNIQNLIKGTTTNMIMVHHG
jgi:hypothetical protein